MARVECCDVESLELRQLLSAVTLQLSASADNTIYAAAPDHSNGSGEYILTGGGTRGLIRFDLAAAAIPDGSTIIDAVLSLNLADSLGGSTAVSLHRVDAPWGEGASNASGDETSGADAEHIDATWTFATWGGQRWDQPGGDFSGLSATTVIGGTGLYEWFGGALIDDVQSWLDNSANNFGWLLDAGSEGIKSFVSRNAPDSVLAPRLEVTYEEPPQPPAIVEGRLWNDLNGDGIQTDPLVSQLQLRIINNNTHFDGFGGEEHWFRSAANNSWYFLKEDGTLTRWDNQGGSLTGQVVGTVDTKYYLQPALVTSSTGSPEPWLNGWTVELLDAAGAVLQTTQSGHRDTNGDGTFDAVSEGGWYRFEVTPGQDYSVRQVIPDGWKETVKLSVENADPAVQGVGQLNLRRHNSYYENIGGLGEKWLRDAEQGWFYILPSGLLYRWNGKPFTAEQPLTGTLIADVGPEFFINPELFASYQPNTGDSGDEIYRTDFGNTVSRTVKGRVWLDFYPNGTRDHNLEGREVTPDDSIGDGEEWFFDADNDSWYIIDVDGHARYWGPYTDPQDILTSGGHDLVLKSEEPWLNGRTVELLDVNGVVIASTQTRSIDLNGDGAIQYETERGWYIFEDVVEGDYTLRTVVGADWTQTAPVSSTQMLVAQINEQLGLRTTASDFLNWGGQNERWLLDQDNRWYYILPDGSLYRWDTGSGGSSGSLNGTFVARLNADYHADLTLLTEPDTSAAMISVSSASTPEEILFGNHRLLGELL